MVPKHLPAYYGSKLAIVASNALICWFKGQPIRLSFEFPGITTLDRIHKHLHYLCLNVGRRIAHWHIVRLIIVLERIRFPPLPPLLHTQRQVVLYQGVTTNLLGKRYRIGDQCRPCSIAEFMLGKFF